MMVDVDLGEWHIGDNKVSDASNFGLFKQNWGMLRECGSRAGFVGQSADEWNNGAKLKYDHPSLPTIMGFTPTPSEK